MNLPSFREKKEFKNHKTKWYAAAFVTNVLRYKFLIAEMRGFYRKILKKPLAKDIDRPCASRYKNNVINLSNLMSLKF